MHNSLHRIRKRIAQAMCRAGWHGPWRNLSIDERIVRSYQCQSCFLYTNDPMDEGLYGWIRRTYWNIFPSALKKQIDAEVQEKLEQAAARQEYKQVHIDNGPEN